MKVSQFIFLSSLIIITFITNQVSSLFGYMQPFGGYGMGQYGGYPMYGGGYNSMYYNNPCTCGGYGYG
uniref:Uncharacterized protein n=1 Tax=Parastrongyloides trichosuri TaxID=131310 RepID=A0A0N5A2V6_PARTI